MGSIERYIARQTAGAFILVTLTLTATIWVTTALREFDLLTSQGQTALVFLRITGLSIPLLLFVIAPIGFFVACMHVMNKLSTDSELIVMSAAGMSPWRGFRPMLAVGLMVSVFVAAIAIQVAPWTARQLQIELSQVRADVVASLVREGRFTTIDRYTFHIRERGHDNTLNGLFVQDLSDPQHEIIFLAERGQVTEVSGTNFLVLENGSIQRREKGRDDPAIVLFERYAFDLSKLAQTKELTFNRPRERYIWELVNPPANDPAYRRGDAGRFRAELHDRLTAPLYPVAFLVIAYAFLGTPRTTRQGRGQAMAGAVLTVGAVRLLGFYATTLVVREPWAVALVYAAPLGAIVAGLLVIGGVLRLKLPAVLTRALDAAGDRVMALVARRVAS